MAKLNVKSRPVSLEVSGVCENHQAQFAKVFECIYDYLGAYYWIVSADCFKWPDHWVEDPDLPDPQTRDAENRRLVAQVAYPHNFIYYAERIFPSFAPYVKNTSNSLFGFRCLPASPSDWACRYFDAQNRARYIQDTTDVSFVNADSAYWVIYAKDTTMIETVKNHLLQDPSIRLTPYDHCKETHWQ